MPRLRALREAFNYFVIDLSTAMLLLTLLLTAKR